jgi:hypothetical protein
MSTSVAQATPLPSAAETGDLDGPARLGRLDGLRSAVLVRGLRLWRHSRTASLPHENWQAHLERVGENVSLRQITYGSVHGMVQRDLRSTP